MYQEIAVAKGAEYDFLNQKMDNCQENIETLSDEIQRLQGKNRVFVLSIPMGGCGTICRSDEILEGPNRYINPRAPRKIRTRDSIQWQIMLLSPDGFC